MAPKLVMGSRDPDSKVVHDFSRVAARAALVAGFVYLLGSLFDLWILWFADNPGNIQYEFVALTRTTEGFPRLLVATALIYLGMYLGGEVRPMAYKLLAAWVLVLGVGALAVLALLGLNYAGMSANVTEEGRALFRSAMIKAGGLSVLYVVSLLPLGFLGFSTRKR
jgi:hypothetical protein